MRTVHAMGVMEGSIAAALSDIQERFPAVDIGSYPFRRGVGWGVAIVAKGTDIMALEEVIAQATDLLATQNTSPVQGEPAA